MVCLSGDLPKTSQRPRSKKVEIGGEWWRREGEGTAHTSVVAIPAVCRFLLFGFLRVAGCFQCQAGARVPSCCISGVGIVQRRIPVINATAPLNQHAWFFLDRVF